MKVHLTVFYEDGSSCVIEIEKPAGAHPDSLRVAAEGLLAAELGGKRVARIGRSKVNPFSDPNRGPLVIDDHLMSRQYVLTTLQLMVVPMDERYRTLYS